MNTPPQPSTRTIESLGKVTYATKPNTSNLVAGGIIAALLVGGGLFLTGKMLQQMWLNVNQNSETSPEWVSDVFATVIGLALVVGGVFLFRWVKSMIGFRLSVCREGFYFTRGGVETVFAWDEIVQVRETILHEKMPLAKGPARQLMPTQTSRNYLVVRCDGKEFYFDQNVIARTSLLAGPLASAGKKHGFAWESAEENG